MRKLLQGNGILKGTYTSALEKKADVDVSSVVDQLMEFARPSLRGNRNNYRRIPGFSTTTKDYFGKEIGTVKCDKGEVRDLSTVKRRGPAYLRRITEGNGEELIFAILLNIEKLNLIFNPCTIDILGYDVVKVMPINMTATDNAAFFMLSIIGKGTGCKVKLRKSKIKTLSGITISKIGSAKRSQWITSYLNTQISINQREIIEKVQTEFDRLVSAAVAKAKLCKVIKGMQFFG